MPVLRFSNLLIKRDKGKEGLAVYLHCIVNKRVESQLPFGVTSHTPPYGEEVMWWVNSKKNGKTHGSRLTEQHKPSLQDWTLQD